jgi:hypothetical protein
VIIQEIFGVNHHIRNVVDRFATQATQRAPALFDSVERDSFSKPDAELAQQGTLALFTRHLG